jgi:hypothetical protein
MAPPRMSVAGIGMITGDIPMPAAMPRTIICCVSG